MKPTFRSLPPTACLVGALALVAFSPRNAHAAEFGESEWERPYDPNATGRPPPPEPHHVPKKQVGQRYVGLLLNAGLWTGLGLGVQVGIPRVGLRVSGGWIPILIETRASYSNRSTLNVYSSGVISADFFLNLFSADEPERAGPLFGYRYDSLLGHGLAVGGWGGIHLSRSLDMLLEAGAMGYFKGEDNLRHNANISDDYSFGFPGPSFAIGVAGTLAIFPG